MDGWTDGRMDSWRRGDADGRKNNAGSSSLYLPGASLVDSFAVPAIKGSSSTERSVYPPVHIMM